MDRAELRALVRATGCAVEGKGAVFLFDRAWSAADASEARGHLAQAPDARSTASGETGLGWLGIRTGGSGGGVKFARHDEQTLSAAVAGFQQHFGLARVNAVDVLPPHHVSGLMARVRCAATGGRHVPWSWQELAAGQRPRLDTDSWVISLVPTQLQRLLAQSEAVAWLQRFALIFVGGGPVWPELAERAADAKLNVSPSYGMTETAAMVTALRPAEFLAGARSCGAALPHAKVEIVPGQGVVRISGASLFRGYWPSWDAARTFVTEDLGRIDERGHLHVLGRRDAVIITGGKKVQPAEVEAVLRASGEFDDVVVLGVPDPEWGEAVVACYPAHSRGAPDVARAVAGLAGYQQPKRFVAIAAWPRNAQGKVNRAELRAQLSPR